MNRTDECLDDCDLTDLISGALTGPDAERATAHVGACPRCQRRMENATLANQLATQLPSLNEAKTESVVLDDVIAEAKSLRVQRESSSVAAAQAETITPFNTEVFTEDGYELIETIGQGGMGVVYKARERSLDRLVAIKVLAPTVANDSAAGQRFLREARTAASVVHPNIITIHAVSDKPPLPYLVMEYVEGVSLQQQLDSGSPISFANTIRIGRQMAAGLDAAHQNGLVHRDIKPANILLNARTGKVLLSDFGLALATGSSRYTSSGTLVGTAAYVAPETLEGSSLADHRSDLYGLGVVLYAMCSGDSPFQADTLLATIRRVAASDPPPLMEVRHDVPPWFSHLVMRLLDKEPDARFQTAAEVHVALGQGQDVSGSASTGTRSDPPSTPASIKLDTGASALNRRRRKRDRSTAHMVIGVVGLLVAAGLVLGVSFLVSTNGSSDRVAGTNANADQAESDSSSRERSAAKPDRDSLAKSLYKASPPTEKLALAGPLGPTRDDLAPFACFASDGSRLGSFADLEDAVENQPEGGWIEISGHLHVISTPVFVEDSYVSIRAAQDAKPVFVFDPVADLDDPFDEEFDDEDDFDDDDPDDEAMLNVVGHLAMRGIEIRVDTDDWELPIIRVEPDGTLELTKCVLSSMSPGCCVASQAGVTLNECQIHASASAAIELEAADGVTSVLRDCWVSGLIGIELSGEERQTLLLDHCAFACEQSIRVYDDQEDGPPAVRSDASLFFNFESVVGFDDEVESRELRWTGSGNVYAGSVTRMVDESGGDGGFARWTVRTRESDAQYARYPFQEDLNSVLRRFDNPSFRLSEVGLLSDLVAGPRRDVLSSEPLSVSNRNDQVDDVPGP
ncbi:MAG: serine/threonine-protein kinase [Planctomycetota bacterium]